MKKKTINLKHLNLLEMLFMKDHIYNIKKPLGSTCLPEKTDKCYKKFMQPGDPSQKTILVSGDVKRPVDYKQLYSSLRHRGHNAYNQGVTF